MAPACWPENSCEHSRAEDKDTEGRKAIAVILVHSRAVSAARSREAREREREREGEGEGEGERGEGEKDSRKKNREKETVKGGVVVPEVNAILTHQDQEGLRVWLRCIRRRAHKCLALVYT